MIGPPPFARDRRRAALPGRLPRHPRPLRLPRQSTGGTDHMSGPTRPGQDREAAHRIRSSTASRHSNARQR
jgi:hypothetical protein